MMKKTYLTSKKQHTNIFNKVVNMRTHITHVYISDKLRNNSLSTSFITLKLKYNFNCEHLSIEINGKKQN